MPEARQRRPRLSDAETERRMLDAALAALAEHGMSVGLDDVRLEDVIRAAGVSRTSAYRRWPSRERFVEDLLVEVARHASLTGVVESIADDVVGLVAGLPAGPVDDATRHDTLVELLRLSFGADLRASAASREFRTYLGLQAAFVGLRSDGLRDEVRRALVAREDRATERGARLLAAACEAFGLRLVAPLAGGTGHGVVSRAVAAATTGFLVAGLAEPELLTGRTTMAAHGSTRPAAWSVPELALTGIVLGWVERDPAAGGVDDLPERVRGLVAAAVP